MTQQKEEQWKEQYPPKVRAMYEAVLQLFASGRELVNLKVEEITRMAGIGKGTAYEYFSTKEEIVIGALDYGARCYMEVLFQLLEEKKTFREVVFKALSILEEANDTYQGFVLAERILADRELTGKGILDEMGKHKERFMEVLTLRNRFADLAMEDENIAETDRYKVESAIVSQFLSYGFYLAHSGFFSKVEQEKAREFAYESIVKILK